MVTAQEIVERTLYMCLLQTTKRMGLTLDPHDYLSEGEVTKELEEQFQRDKASMEKFIYVFGIGNNQSRGIKECPRITLELGGFYPGTVGVEKYMIDNTKAENPCIMSYPDFTTHDISIDVHLVSDNLQDLRLLHTIMYSALPAMGYVKPFYNDREEWINGKMKSTDNIFIEVSNYYDRQDNDHGLIEKIYTYKISDGIIITEDPDWSLTPIKDISLFINEDKLNCTSNDTQGI
jgi:hypothetical protein